MNRDDVRDDPKADQRLRFDEPVRPVSSSQPVHLDPSIKTHADYVARIKQHHLGNLDRPQRVRYDGQLHGAEEREVKINDTYGWCAAW